MRRGCSVYRVFAALKVTSTDVAEWLRGLGLEQYVLAFRDNDIDGEGCPG
jgi:SAM (Sterile alpha motif) domain-containing protein